MDITQEQMPPTSRPPMSEKGVSRKERPDTGPRPDMINPEDPEEGNDPPDPAPDMDPDGRDPVEGEVIN